MKVEELKLNVLIVEDDPEFLSALVNCLAWQMPRSSIATTSTAIEAMALLSEQPFDLVMIDYQLAQRANGLVIWEISSKRLPNTKFVMMSGSHTREILSGVQGHASMPKILSKPFSADELKKTLGECFPAA